VLVLSGDIDAKTAKDKVAKYFGDIPAGPPVARQAEWVAPRTTSTRSQMEDVVSQTRILREWNIPARSERDFVLLDLASDVLGGGKTSRLYQRLVYQDKLVDSVSASASPFELGSQFEISADVKQGADPAKVEAAIADEVQKFLANGPTADELARVQAQDRAGTIRGLERALGKASRLGESALYLGSPDAWKTQFEWQQQATPAEVQAVAKKWLAQGDYTLTVVPTKTAPKVEEVAGLPASPDRPADIPGIDTSKFTVAKSDVDRGKGVPEVTSFPDLSFPKVERGHLKNGIEVVLAQRHTIPVVNVALQLDAG
jgi:predicted Zn-dependent peptidase